MTASLFYPSISANGRFVAFTSYASQPGRGRRKTAPKTSSSATESGRDDADQGVRCAPRPLQRHPLDLGQRTLRRLRVRRPGPGQGRPKRGRSTSFCTTESGARRRSSASVPRKAGKLRQLVPRDLRPQRAFRRLLVLGLDLVGGDRFDTADAFVRRPLRPLGGLDRPLPKAARWVAPFRSPPRREGRR